ncbi:MAG: DUF433 domain-containing protein [Candidatus Kapabacteria bacterium]|jgi:uncharacterized protein (DUF433 family)|nr:DUF433 domain-containing protein [Candidatus Kapabacteria bacterium]
MLQVHYRFQRITINPDICLGKPCIRGMRMPVSSILDYLSGGMAVDDLLRDFPYLEREDITQALAFSAVMLQDEFVPLAVAS